MAPGLEESEEGNTLRAFLTRHHGHRGEGVEEAAFLVRSITKHSDLRKGPSNKKRSLEPSRKRCGSPEPDRPRGLPGRVAPHLWVMAFANSAGPLRQLLPVMTCLLCP